MEGLSQCVPTGCQAGLLQLLIPVISLTCASCPRYIFAPFALWKTTAFHLTFRECVKHFKMNHTWGRLHAPYVDKVEAKEIVKRARVTGLDVIPTLALLDKKNISQYSLELMKSLKQPYIIKSSHMSGGVARVSNNRYQCFKYCDYGTSEMPLGEKALELSKKQLTMDIELDYSRNGGELQYRKPLRLFVMQALLL